MPEFSPVPWNSAGRSTDFDFFFMESGGTLSGLTRHNNKNVIPVIFRAQSSGMSNSVNSPAEFWDSSGNPVGISGGE
jgi:hypothetical protein